VTGVLLPASTLFLGRPMPPGRALVDAGAAVALATDFNPGSAFCESLPLVCSLAATQLNIAPEEALSACTVNAAHVLGRADRKGRLAPGYDADVVLVAADDWRHLAYHLGGPVVHTVIAGGRSPGDARHNRLMATKKQRRRRAKEHRHDYVWVDEEGNEVEAPDEEPTRDLDESEWTAPRSAGAVVAAHVQTGRDLRADHVRHGVPALAEPRAGGEDHQTLLIVAIFIPFSYFLDRFFYRSSQRRAARREQSDGRRGS
jgi:hypothetical protein